MSPPIMTAAVAEQVHRGTHYGACHELEVAWAEQIAKMVPSAEWVRFTMSGTGDAEKYLPQGRSR